MVAMLLDNLIRSVSPEWALRREHARARLALVDDMKARARNYDAADRGRRTSGWLTIGAGANQEIRGALDVMRARSRDLRKNNPHARAAIGVLRGHMAGRGIRPKFMHERDAVVREVSAHFDEWANYVDCDVAGRLSWYAMQGVSVEGMVEGGEALVQRVRRPRSTKLRVPLQLQLLEPDYLDTSKGVLSPTRSRAGGGNVVIQGVEFNGDGQPVAVWLFKDHPGESFYTTSTESKRVPIENLSRMYRMDRIGQVRGVPWGAPVILRLHDYQTYEDSEQLRMVAATAFSGFVKDIAADVSFTDGIGPLGLSPRPSNRLGQKIDEIEPGTISYLPPGKDIQFTSPPQNEGFAEYSTVQLRAIAKGYGVPHWLMSDDLANVNFSTTRASLSGWDKEVGPWRDQTLVLHFCEPTLRWWIEQAVVAGVFSRDGLSWVWMQPRRLMTDPRTEVNAEIAMVRAGMKSLSQVIEEFGMDSRKVLEQLQKDLEFAGGLGLVLSVDGSVMPGPTNENVNGNGGGGGRAGAADWGALADRLTELVSREVPPSREEILDELEVAGAQ